MTAIFKKELKSYFVSMSGYITIFSIVFFSGLFFTLINVFNMTAEYQYVVGSLPFIFYFITPMITMRSFSEEKKQKTELLLFSSPVKISGIVMGKFLSAWTLIFVGTTATLIFPIILQSFGEMPWSTIMTAYLGFLLMAGTYVAIGIFISTFTENQIVSATWTVLAIIFFNYISSIASSLPQSQQFSIIFLILIGLLAAYYLYTNTQNFGAAAILFCVVIVMIVGIYLFDPTIYDGLATKILSFFSVPERFYNFINGILNVSDVVFFVSIITMFNYLTMARLDKKRWI